MSDNSAPISGNNLRTVETKPNASRAMESLRDMGYNAYSSILDLIDNCIDAEASEVLVRVVDDGGIKISILDNGKGMDEETLIEALKLGSDTKKEAGELGKFGMGLVTASIAIARNIKVDTHNGLNTAYYGELDLDSICKANAFIASVGSSPCKDFEWAAKLEKAGGGFPWLSTDTGTSIVLSKVDRLNHKNIDEFCKQLSKKIGQVFRKFIKAKTISIKVNGIAVTPIDPLLMNHPNTKCVLDTTMEIEDGKSVEIKVVELPDEGSAGNKSLGITMANAGFYVLRNSREIMAAETFNMFSRHPDLAHFRAELNFDAQSDKYFNTDIKKSSIHWNQSFVDRVSALVSTLIKQSSKASRVRSKEGKGTINHSISEGNINRRKSLIPKGPKQTTTKKPQKEKPGPKKTKEGGPTGGSCGLRIKKTMHGLRVEFREANHGEEGPFYSLSQEEKAMVITYNTQHPFWVHLIEANPESKAIAIVDYLVFSMANAECVVPEQAMITKANINSTLIGLLV